ncbi:MAG: HxsD-like protein [Candidatus Gracilibacteria bacterium]|nr:HxsD-like protein [Candidatus Gracilibacteria bacterium]
MSKISLKIDNSIYDYDIVLQAIEDYKDIAFIQNDNGYIYLESKDNNEEEILNEFLNYVINLQNESI